MSTKRADGSLDGYAEIWEDFPMIYACVRPVSHGRGLIFFILLASVGCPGWWEPVGSTESATDVADMTPEDTPKLQLDFSQVKRFDFSWESTGAHNYQLLERVGFDGDYLQLAPDISGDLTSLSLHMPLHLRADASYILRACTGGTCRDSAPVMVEGTLTKAVGRFESPHSENTDFFGSFGGTMSADGTTVAISARSDDSSATGVGGDYTDTSAPDSGAVYVFVQVGDTWKQQAYIKASNTAADDWFGETLALSADGDTLAVGTPLEDSGATGIGDGTLVDFSAPNSGAVYIFRRQGETWAQESYLKASNAEAGDVFGQSPALSVDGNSLVVGARGEGSGVVGDQADNSVEDAGAAYVFVRDQGTWSQQAYLKAPHPDPMDYFGDALALSADGMTIAVGMFFDDAKVMGIDGEEDNASSDSGAVYIFTRNGQEWSNAAYIKASNASAEDNFGVSVALSAEGNTLVVGARDEDGGGKGVDGDPWDNSVSRAGAAYVFSRSGGVWSQQAYLKAPNPGAEDVFGDGVAISGDGNTVAVGAFLEDGGALGLNGDPEDDTVENAGAVYVFTRSNDKSWSYKSYVKAAESDKLFGSSHEIALSHDGTTLLVAKYLY